MVNDLVWRVHWKIVMLSNHAFLPQYMPAYSWFLCFVPSWNQLLQIDSRRQLTRFIFQLKEYLCSNTCAIFLFDIPVIFLEQNLYTTDICRTWMHFLQVNVTFYDAVNLIHDVIKIDNLFPYTSTFMFVRVRNDKTQLIRRWKIKRIRP